MLAINGVPVEDTFAEAFGMRATSSIGRIPCPFGMKCWAGSSAYAVRARCSRGVSGMLYPSSTCARRR